MFKRIISFLAALSLLSIALMTGYGLDEAYSFSGCISTDTKCKCSGSSCEDNNNKCTNAGGECFTDLLGVECFCAHPPH